LASIYQYQSASLQATGSIYVTLNNTQQNDVIVVIVGVKGNQVFPSSITDSLGNNYLPTVTQVKYNLITIFYAINKGSGTNTITVTFPSPVDAMLIAVELSGINLSNPVSAQISGSGDTTNPSLSISPASTNQFVLGAILYEFEPSATPSPAEAPTLSPASPALALTSIGIASDYLELSTEYVPDSNNLSALAWISQQSNLPYWDAIVVLFNLPSAPTTTTPCSSLPFPLNDICSGITSLSQEITSTGQGIFNGLSYVAQAIYNAFSTLAKDFVSAWQYLSQYIVNAFNTFGQWIDTAFRDIGQWIYNAFNYIFIGLSQFGNWIWSGIVALGQAIVSFVNWAWQGIVGTFNAIYNAFTTGTEQLISSFESGIVGIQNALVNKLHDMIVVSLTMPAEFSLFNAFKDNISKGNTKGILGSLGGILATPILADIIATFLSNYIQPQPISKLLPRPSLPSITMPTPTLQYSPTPAQTSAPPTQPPPAPTTTVVSTGTTVTASVGTSSSLSISAGITTVTAQVGQSSSVSASASSSVSAST